MKITQEYINKLKDRYGYDQPSYVVNGTYGKVTLTNTECNVYVRLLELEECFDMVERKHPFRVGMSKKESKIIDGFLEEFEEIRDWFRNETKVYMVLID